MIVFSIDSIVLISIAEYLYAIMVEGVKLVHYTVFLLLNGRKKKEPVHIGICRRTKGMIDENVYNMMFVPMNFGSALVLQQKNNLTDLATLSS